MRTTLYLPDTLLNELIAETGEKDKTKIIKTALEEFLRKLKRMKLKRLRGKIELDLDVVQYRQQV